MIRQSVYRFFLLIGGALLAGCGAPDDGVVAVEPSTAVDEVSTKLSVFTTFYPTQYFAERIGEGLVSVQCPIPDDEDPIFWMPDEAAIQGYQAADLILLNGAGFAKWIDKVTLPGSRTVSTAEPLSAEFVKYENAIEHSHGEKGAHSHEGIDGHTWVDPVNAKVQAGEIRDALVRLLPGARATLDANFEAIAADLDALDAELRKLAAAGMPPLLCSHPAYNYIARRYGWDIHNLDLDPGEMPSDETIAEIKNVLEEHPAKWMLWEAEPLPEILKRFNDEMGVHGIVFTPCELLSSEERSSGADYLSVMKENIAKLQAVTQWR